jgi:hypothetical protein
MVVKCISNAAINPEARGAIVLSQDLVLQSYGLKRRKENAKESGPCDYGGKKSG